jgi:repressor of nif and glnA expression
MKFPPQISPANRRYIQKCTMQETQRQILHLILSDKEGISDTEIVEKLGKNLQEVRFHLDELSEGGFINLSSGSTFDDDFYLATSVTPRGHMVIKGQISLDDRINSKSNSQNFHITNKAPIGSQQFGNYNTAQINQNIGIDVTDILQIIEDLKKAVNDIPLDKQEIAVGSLAIIEEEVIAPKPSSKLNAALLALWSVTKDIVTFANAVTAIADRFNINLPGLG